MKSFLIVDDDEIIRSVCELIIEKQFKNSLVDLAENGQVALTKMMERDYSVIIADVEMPVMNGIDFFNRLKEENTSMSQKVGFICGAPNTDTISFFLKERRPYLLKPFGAKNLRMLVNSVLDNCAAPVCFTP